MQKSIDTKLDNLIDLKIDGTILKFIVSPNLFISLVCLIIVPCLSLGMISSPDLVTFSFRSFYPAMQPIADFLAIIFYFGLFMLIAFTILIDSLTFRMNQKLVRLNMNHSNNYYQNVYKNLLLNFNILKTLRFSFHQIRYRKNMKYLFAYSSILMNKYKFTDFNEANEMRVNDDFIETIDFNKIKEIQDSALNLLNEDKTLFKQKCVLALENDSKDNVVYDYLECFNNFKEI